MDARFDTTQWSVILAAKQRSEPGADEALARLCEAYWFPLYAFVRRKVRDAEQARDLTQAYFVKLLEKDYLDSVHPEGGRFRSFLLASVKHFLLNEWKAERTQRRGGHATILSLDLDDAENRFLEEPADDENPERLFARRWARTALERTMKRMRSEHDADGKLTEYEALAPFLTAGGSGRSYADVGRRLERSEAAVKMAVHRMRRRFGELLRMEIGRTVTEPEEIDTEIRHLFDALRG